MSTPEELEDLQGKIVLGEALQRLVKNKDFKLLISKMYLDDGCNYLAKNMVVAKDRQRIAEQILARGELMRFFEDISNDHVSAVTTLHYIQSETEEE